MKGSRLCQVKESIVLQEAHATAVCDKPDIPARADLGQGRHETSPFLGESFHEIEVCIPVSVYLDRWSK